MKFMLTWRVHPDKRQAAFNAFSQMNPQDDLKDMGDKIKLIGCWHDLSDFTGFCPFRNGTHRRWQVGP